MFGRRFSRFFDGSVVTKKKGRSRAATSRRLRKLGTMEVLEGRQMLAVTALFTPGSGVLSVFGDAADNTIVVSRNAAGSLLVNGGAVPILGGAATVANTALVQIFGLSGNDNLALDEANGALPRANLFGGAGNDRLTGGSGGDLLFGQAGNDTLLGKGGADLLFGGADADVLFGGDGDDQAFGEGGNDRLIWNPGDDTDLNEGGAGFDTIEVNGGNGAESFTATANGTRVRFDRITPAPFSIDIGTSEALVVNANGGDDSFAATGNLAALIQITVDGGAGNDTLLGSNGADTLIGGDGDDFLDGNQGVDTLLGGQNNDTFQWDPGDGNDVIEGGAGSDRLVFNGANIGENLEVAANGERLRVTRNIANITLDVNDVETADFNAFGGADVVTVNDLSGTDVTAVNIFLGALGGAGDLSPDTVVVNGTAGADNVQIVGAGSNYAIVGLPVAITVAGSEAANDTLVLNALGGSDVVNASLTPAGQIKLLTIDGGADNDIITGSQFGDVLIGGAGADVITGGRGDDRAVMGDDNDTFVWNPGDGSDVVEGEGGFDTLVFNGADINEIIDLFANGSRLRLTRDVGSVAMDGNGLEQVNVAALAGADTVTIGDLTGVGVTMVNLNLAAAGGGGDGQADRVIVNGTFGNDNVIVNSTVSLGARVGGLAAVINVAAVDAALDQLTINALSGEDTINASNVAAGMPLLALNGGAGNDTILGGAGNDLVTGGQGDDTVLLGDGDDTFTWNPGDGNDVVEGQAGFDALVFNGANISEILDVSANGSRVRLTRNVASITMDLNSVEQINLNAVGGADVITVNDLAGTNVTLLNLNLSGVGGLGDGAADSVILNGSSGDDAVAVNGNASGASVLGLAAAVNIYGAETANDRLTINALAGDDLVDASGLAADGIALTLDGGEGADVLVGGDGNDTLLGGLGDDVLIGGPGNDILDGGPGDNVVIQ